VAFRFYLSKKKYSLDVERDVKLADNEFLMHEYIGLKIGKYQMIDIKAVY